MIEGTLGVAGPEMDPRRGEYADFPPTAGDADAVNGQPEERPASGPEQRPRRPKKT